jgi:hypothetical protein
VGGSAGSAVPGLIWAHPTWPQCVALTIAVQALTIAVALGFWKPLPKGLVDLQPLTAAIEEG